MVRIPIEYQEVEYIESTNDAYINTSQYFTQAEYSVQIDIMPFERENGYFGVRKTSNVSRNSIAIGFSNNANRFRMLSQHAWQELDYAILFGKKYTINGIFNNFTQKISIDDNTVSQSGYLNWNSISSMPILLFAIYLDYNTTPTKSHCRIYDYKITKNGVLIQNLIPCYRKSDNEPGMYDTVSKTFFTNSGTGTFLVGNDVNYSNTNLLEVRRRILLNTPHLESMSGNPAIFTTDMAANLKECKIRFTPVQAGGGTPSPENVRAISGWDGVTVNANDTSISIPFPQTIFGGYVDLIKGEIVEEIDSEGQEITPNVYPLTPQTIKALRGLNNLYSDANGNIEVKFWKH